MSVNNLPHLTLYLYNEETGEKGSDEVISCIHHYVQNKLPTTVEELDIWTDGCAGQCWNNYVAAFFEMLLDKHSPLHEKTTNLVHITLWRNPRGHTYMETDSQGGQLAHRADCCSTTSILKAPFMLSCCIMRILILLYPGTNLQKKQGLTLSYLILPCSNVGVTSFLTQNHPLTKYQTDRIVTTVTQCHQINFGVSKTKMS